MNTLAGTGLVYAGLGALAVGLVSLARPLRFLGVRSRGRGALVAAAGGAALGLGLFLPPPPIERSNDADGLIARFLPEYRFSERHERVIPASPERVFAAVRSVTAGEIALFRLLTTVRNPGRLFRRQPAGILNPSADSPILDDARRSGFVLLAEDPGREIVLGLFVARPRGAPRPDPETFADLSAPGYAKAVINFRIRPRQDGACLLTTETRVLPTDSKTARAFAAYWRVIYPGSSLLRVTWLSAIARRAATAS
jgi:hypothetical protein